ncbi:MAG: hypothetical protein JSS57_21465 [Proteobacteria bacterium]|nr:hypothetical protein [Pseudomonadota bacterium]
MALPGTLGISWGNRTLRRFDGAVIPGVVDTDALVLTGAASTAGFVVEKIADEYNVLRWMLTVGGTSATAPPATISGLADGATVLGTLAVGATTCALTITIEGGVYGIRPKWSDTTTTYEGRQTLLNTVMPVRLGDQIKLRPGTYGLVGGVKSYTQRIRFLTPTGTWTGSNWVKISPRDPLTTVWAGTLLDGFSAEATGRNAYLWFDQINWSVPLLDGQDPNSTSIFSGASVSNYVKITNCQFLCPETIGTPPTGTGRDLSIAITANGSFWYIEDNRAENVWIFCTSSSVGDTLVITGNDIIGCYNDGFKTNHYNIKFEDNFITNKRCADPSTLSGSDGAHPDTVQHLGWSDGISRTIGTYKRNIMVRGDGRPSWPDGQGMFLTDSKNGSSLLGLEMENNFVIMTMQNGISLTNSIDPVVRGNATILDPTVGGVVNTNTGTDPYIYTPAIALGGESSATAHGGILSGNIRNQAVITYGNHNPPPVATNNITLDPAAVSGPSSYAENFVNPEFGAVLNSRAAVIARFTPKVGGPVDLAGAGPWDTSGNWRTYGAATQVTMAAPAGGPELVPSANFTIGANGSITGTVTVTPSDGGAGGTFTPPSVAISSGTPTATFTYTPPAGSATRTISVTNNGGLTNPPSVSYVVNAPSATMVTLSGPEQLLVGTTGTLTAEVDGFATGDLTITLNPVVGLTFGGVIVIQDGTSSGSTTITASTPGTKTISGSNNGGLAGPASINVVAFAPAVTYGNVAALVRCGFIAPVA